jgi:branched-chain amino acid transport system substrate-binding protein
MRRRPRRPYALPLIASLAVCAACSQPTAPVAIGVALSTSFIDATRMAIDDVAASGELPPIDTVFVDEQSSRAASALELVDSFRLRRNLVAVVGHSISPSSLATAPVYNANGIVQIAPTSTAAQYSAAGPFSFRMVPGDERQGGFMARAIDSLYPAGARVALLYVNDDYGRGLRSALIAHLDTTRYTLAYHQPHSDDEFGNPNPDRAQRVRATVTSMLASRPDVVIWLGRPGTFAFYLQMLRELGGPIPVIGGDALANWRDSDTGQGHWDGVRYVDFLDLEQSLTLKEFRQRFRERFGRNAGTPEVLSYDAMHLILSAIRDGARTGDEVRQWLDRLGAEGREPYYGVSGRIVFEEQGDIDRSYVLVRIGPEVQATSP